jgi:hypothetical protein
MVTTERDTTSQGYAENLDQLLAEVWAAIDADEDYESQPANEYLDEMPLEIVWEKGEPFSVLLTFGGPSAQIVKEARWDNYRLDVHWWGDSATLTSEAITRTGRYFYEFIEETDEAAALADKWIHG